MNSVQVLYFSRLFRALEGKALTRRDAELGKIGTVDLLAHLSKRNPQEKMPKKRKQGKSHSQAVHGLLNI